MNEQDILTRIKEKRISPKDFRQAIANGFNFKRATIILPTGDKSVRPPVDALYLCCRFNNLEILLELLKLKPKINLNKIFPNQKIFTPLILSCGARRQKADLKIVSALLAHGADPNFINDAGDDAFIYAICESNIDLLKLLVASGGKVGNSYSGDTLLELSFSLDEISCFEFLLSKRPRINSRRLVYWVAADPSHSDKNPKKIMLAKLADFLAENKKLKLINSFIKNFDSHRRLKYQKEYGDIFRVALERITIKNQINEEIRPLITSSRNKI